ncbi:MAG: hypothetical protein ACOYOB_15450 [Myxococcota bacterium]
MDFARMVRLLFAVTLLGFALSCVAARDACAIPAFARRYETSCQTCHLAFPKLTPFGEAFRRNAYRFPDGGDDLSEKLAPVSLGADAQKDLWPKAVHPGEIPGQVPLSVLVDGMATYGDAPSAHSGAHAGHISATTGGHEDKFIGLGTLGGHVGLRSAGKLGDLASFLASIDVGGHEPIAVERGNLILTPLGPTALHVKLGRFEPEVHGLSIHRGLVGHQLALTTTPFGANASVLEPNRTGIELSGVAAGRFGWSAGAVENATPDLYNDKDVYGRVEAKLGGMRLDGVGAEAQSAAWRERSVTLGASGWVGKAAVAETGTAWHDDAFVRAGVDLHAVFDDLLVDLVAARQMNESPTPRFHDGGTLDQLFAEVTYVTSAVFFPTVRFESARVSELDEENGVRWQAMAAINALLRPNVLLRAEGALAAAPGDHAEFSYAALAFSTAF